MYCYIRCEGAVPDPVGVRLRINGSADTARVADDRDFLLSPAEGVRFELTVSLRPQRFSRPPHSTALPPLRVSNHAGFSTIAIASDRPLTAK